MAGEFSLNQALFFPVDVVRRVAANLEPLAAEKGIKLRLEGAENLPEKLVGDQERLIEVFTRGFR